MLLSAFFLLTWTLNAFACSRIATMKGRNPITWFYIGFFGGLICLIVLILLKPIKQTSLQPDSSKSVAPPPSAEELQIKELRTKHWYYLDKNFSQYGPMSFDAFKKSFEEGTFSEEQYIWNEDLTDWKRLKELTNYHSVLDIKKPEA